MKKFFYIWLFGALVWLTVVGLLVWVIAHFVSKFW